MNLSKLVPPVWRKALKARLKEGRIAFNARFRSYGRPELLAALRRLGLREGDTVMLHAAFSREHGFRGNARDLADVFLEALGPRGHLLMPSLPTGGASLDWLESGRRFDVRRTPSMMGMVSESFRRREGVQRSLHPTHPILVHGPEAARFIAAHPDCLYPCGPGTPFDELQKADGRVVFFNVAIDSFTFFHWLEHMVHETLPFPLYTEQPFDAPVVDADGRARTVRTYAFARAAIARRRPWRLYDALFARGSVTRVKVGASELLSLRVRDAIDCTRELQRDGHLFYEMA